MVSDAPTAASKPSRLHGLDGLRGVAALMVFVYHGWWRAGNPQVSVAGLQLGELATTLDIGVCIFFVLSGFLLSRPFWRSMLADTPAQSLRAYLKRRAGRILPAYYLILLILYAPIAYTYTPYGLLEFVLHATCLQTFTDFAYTSRVDPVLWSIAIEFQFYLLLPFLMQALAALYRRLGLGAAVLGLWVLIGLSDGAGRLLFGTLAGRVPVGLVAPEGSAMVNGAIFAYLKWFGAGMTAAVWSLRAAPKPATRGADLVCVLGGFATFALLMLSQDGDWQTVSLWGWPLNTILFAFIVAALPRARWAWRPFETRVIRFFGEISYGVYLWHWPVQVWLFPRCEALIGTDAPLWLGMSLAMMASLLLTVGIASASYYGIERRVIAWSRRP